jgi:hypothetical protein
MKTVSCSWVRDRVSAFLDQSLSAAEANEMQDHARACPDCAARMEDAGGIKASMRLLPRRMTPPALTTSLRVLASRERARQSRWRPSRAAAANLRIDLSLWFNNLMKPIAIPAAGGLMATALLFAMFVSSYPARASRIETDVPTQIYTGATFKGMVPVEFASGDVIVDLVIDEQGRVLDFKFVAGDPTLEKAIKHMLLYTEFNPARSFGQPVSGKVRLSFRRGTIDVRG